MQDSKYQFDFSNAHIEGLQVGDQNIQYVGGSSKTHASAAGVSGESFPALLNHYMRLRLGEEGTAGKLVKLVYEQFAVRESDLPRSTVDNWRRATKPVIPRDWWTVGALASVLCKAEDDAARLLKSAGHATIAERRSQRERGMTASDALANRVEEEILNYWMNQSFTQMMQDE